LNIFLDLEKLFERSRINHTKKVITEHKQMLEYIKKHDAENAAKLMTQHLQGVLDFAKSNIKKA